MMRAPVRVWLTGATGFLGSHFVFGRAEHNATFTCLVRGENRATAKERLLNALGACSSSYCRPFNRELFEERVHVELGDLCQPRCAVPDHRVHELRANAPDEFWHFAASLNFEERQRAKLLRENVEGTRNAIELAAAVGAKLFVYVSTAYTAGQPPGRVDEALHPPDGVFNNPYEETKCLAEHEVAQQCPRRGIDFRIVRPGIVVGVSSTLRPGGSDTGLYGLVRTIYQLRDSFDALDHSLTIEGEGDTPVPLIPVDDVVHDLVGLAARGFRGGPIYHVTAEPSIDARGIIELICRHTGVRRIDVGALEAQPRSPVEALMDRRTAFYGAYLRNRKEFVRSLPDGRAVTVEDIDGFVHEFMRQLQGETPAESLRSRPRAFVRRGRSVDVLGRRGGRAARRLRQRVRHARRLRTAPGTATLRRLPHPDVGVARCPERQRQVRRQRERRRRPRAGLERVLDAYGAQRVHLIGWCTGVEVCLQFAAQHPDRTLSLVSLNGSGSFYLDADVPVTVFTKNMGALMPKIARGLRYAKVYHQLIYGNRSNQSYLGMSTAERDGEQGQLSDILTSTDSLLLNLTSVPFRTPESLYRYANLITRFHAEPDRGLPERIHAPAFVVSGRQDAVAHCEGSVALAGRLPDSKLLMFEDGDHFILYTEERVVEAVLEFLLTVERGRLEGPVRSPADVAVDGSSLR